MAVEYDGGGEYFGGTSSSNAMLETPCEGSGAAGGVSVAGDVVMNVGQHQDSIRSCI